MGSHPKRYPWVLGLTGKEQIPLVPLVSCRRKKEKRGQGYRRVYLYRKNSGPCVLSISNLWIPPSPCHRGVGRGRYAPVTGLADLPARQPVQSLRCSCTWRQLRKVGPVAPLGKVGTSACCVQGRLRSQALRQTLARHPGLLLRLSRPAWPACCSEFKQLLIISTPIPHD